MSPRPSPAVVRHLTTLLPSGKSVFAPTRLTQLRAKPSRPTAEAEGSPGQFANLFVTDRPRPHVFVEDLSDSDAGSICLMAENGANFRVTDIAPGIKGTMHATSSLDFLIVHKGTVTLHLDSGEKQIVKEGEVIVQRGTVHAWENETNEWVRMFVVLLAADTPISKIT